MDFVHEQVALGKELPFLTIVDTHSRYRLAADQRSAYRGEDVIQTLEPVCHQIGDPQTIKVDKGTAFVSWETDLWAYANDVTLEVPRPAIQPTTATSRPSTASSVGMPERPLFHGSCRCSREAGNFTSRLRRGQTAQRDRIEPIDLYVLGGATSPSP
ncbi:transposase family protein [Pseudoroseicyclus sp. CLL3-39]|uniref:Transposase family protein n=1 Tax=Pseudoroseicyclus tamaricis TaxID=2705421 RepID=A0A6B2JIN4_9RHOB|nr:transposase family protein [Pseudoroseicyclus tamaricis]